MRKVLLAAAIFAGAIGVSTAQADTVGAVWGKPFWGPSISKGHCWTDSNFHRHCNHNKNW